MFLNMIYTYACLDKYVLNISTNRVAHVTKHTEIQYLIKKSIITILQFGLNPSFPPTAILFNTQSSVCNSKYSTSPSCGCGVKDKGSWMSKQNSTSLFNLLLLSILVYDIAPM